MSKSQSVPFLTTPFFTPNQTPPAGTPREDGAPSLFQPIKLRGTTFHNRIAVSPMCQYSADDGHMTMWHKQHLGSLATRGPGLVITEATAVSPQGRISPEDAGLWKESQMAPLKEIVDYAHSQNTKIGIQLAHAGRKASTYSPWMGTGKGEMAPKEARGWGDDVSAPSAVPFKDTMATPHEMTVDEIEQFKKDFGAAVKRSLQIGFDTINIHAAHGYLLSEFLSPSSNHRNDKYGGSLENRARLLIETVELTRSIIPEDYPLMVRMNGTDYLSFDPSLPQWDIEEAAQVGKMLADKGVDWLDISAGGNDSRQQIKPAPGYQVKFASAIKKAVKGTNTIVSSVGAITSGKQAQGYIDSGDVDAVMSARQFLMDPNMVKTWADEMNVPIWVASQYGWAAGIKRDFSQHL